MDRTELLKKWAPILDHESMPAITNNYRKEVTAVLLENQEKASASNGDDSRISSPTTIVAGSHSYSKNLANAIPSENEKSGVISSLTKPLMSYALMIFSNIRHLPLKFFKF